MGRGIAALIDLEVEALADGQEEVEERCRLLDLREAQLDERQQELERRDRELERREQWLGRRPTRAELERMADQIEPPDPGWSNAPRRSTQPVSFEGVERNDPCPCGSGLKFKRCHGSPSGSPSG